MINFELFKIFVIVANEHNISKASVILDLPQSTVAKSIKSLEKDLKNKLFKKVDSDLFLSEFGNALYHKLKTPINELLYIDSQFSGMKNINIGVHNQLLDKLFSNCINKFYLEYPKVNLNFSHFDTEEMLKLLSEKTLDMVLAKKVPNVSYSNLKFIKLGYLNDIFLANKDADLCNKVLTIKDLENEIIYTPKSYSQSVNRLLSFIDIQKSNLKFSSYDDILKSISSSHSLGFITKEYLDENSIKEYNLVELETVLDLKPIEFGIYLNDSSSKELNDLVRIIKSYFFFKDF